jgi:pimeloyl-ACP methyl ester carboxylesterase
MGVAARTIRLAAAALAAGVVGAAALAYRRDLARARARVSSGGRIAATAHGPIEYAENGAGPPVLFVHGAGGGFDQGLAFGAPLAADGFRVIAPSRFGYLGTPFPSDASAEAQADAHAALLDALGVPRAAVVGGSAGAPSALQLALRHPDRVSALVLVVPALFVPRPDGARPLHVPAGLELVFDTALRSDALFWAATRLARDLLLKTMLATPPEVARAASDAEHARVAAILHDVLPVSARRRGLLNDAKVTTNPPRYALERVAAPTLALSVEDDLYGTCAAARYTAEQIPGARFVSYPTGGHVWVGRQAELFAEIAGFLREHAPPR